MGRAKATDKQFNEYIDKLLAGEDIQAGAELTADQQAAMDFARSMVALREEPSARFKDNLRERLRYKLRQQSLSTAENPGFRAWFGQLFSRRWEWQLVTSAAIVVVLAVIAVVWYNSGNAPAPAPSTVTQAPIAPAATTTMPATTTTAAPKPAPVTTTTAAAPAPRPTPAPTTIAPPVYRANLPSRIVPAQVSFTAATALSAAPAQAQIYQVKSPQVTVESITALGRRLGFQGEAMSMDSGNRIVMQDDSSRDVRQLTVWTASGAVEYGYEDARKLFLDSPDLPSIQEAKKIAYDFVMQAGLLPSSLTDYAKIESSIGVIAGGGTSISQQAPSYLLVSFPYLVEGISATGPGSKMEVYIGDGGEVVRLLWAYRELTPSFSQAVGSAERAFYELAQGRGSLDIPLASKQVVVKQVKLSYWLDPLSEKQDYVLPVYEFSGECLDKDGRTLENFEGWVDALSLQT